MGGSDRMKVTFHGAVREVTGSMHLLEAGGDRVLLDCGLFQGRRKESAEKNRQLPVDPGRLSAAVLSHAHIDHSGRIPLLTRNGFNSRVVCTRATADAAEYLLLDSAHIQESDAAYLNYKTVRNALTDLKGEGKNDAKTRSEIKRLLKKGRHRLDTDTIHRMLDRYNLDKVTPLYSIDDAQHALGFIEGYPYRHPVNVGKHSVCTFYEAGHILGSAVSVIRAGTDGDARTVLFTGDLGRFDKPILRDPALDFPEADRRIDLMIMESTYGDRLHEPVADAGEILKKVLTDTHGRGGSVLIPSFAFGRTQELLYVLHELYDSKAVPRMPVYVDSPLATRLTRVFGEHPEVYDKETHRAFLERGKNPFTFKMMRFTESVEESIALTQDPTPNIVIASSGMCEGGRILHHLRYKIHNPKNTILIVGYMARNTLGRRILENGEAYAAAGRKGDPPVLKFLNKEYPLKARVVKLGGFSAHADRDEMLRFLKDANLEINRIAVVHGEEDQSLAFARHLEDAGYSAFVPEVGQTVEA